MVLKSKRQRPANDDVVSSQEKRRRVLNYESEPKTEAAVDNVPEIEVKAETDDVIIDSKICTQE